MALERDGHSIACEISVTSTIGQEIDHVNTSLKAGFDEVIVVSLDRNRLSKLEAQLHKELETTQQRRVQVMAPEEVSSYLANQPVPEASGEQRVRGYRVTVRHQRLSPAQEKARARSISDIIARSVNRLRKDKE